jgi:hypothetical protein
MHPVRVQAKGFNPPSRVTIFADPDAIRGTSTPGAAPHDPEDLQMPDRTFDTSPRVYARVAGLGYLIIIASGIFAEFFVRSGLIVPGSAAATAANILASEPLFRAGLASEFVMLSCDVLLALALYVIFREVSRSLALLAAFFRLVHAAIVGVNLLNTYVPLLLLGGADYLGAFGADQLQALALLFLDAHSYGYVIGLVFFAFHCLVLGVLVLRSRYVPRILGVLLLVAAAGYLIDSFSRTLLTNYADYETVLAIVVFVPAFIGELSFALWLLVKGVDVGSVGLRPAVAR